MPAPSVIASSHLRLAACAAVLSSALGIAVPAAAAPEPEPSPTTPATRPPAPAPAPAPTPAPSPAPAPTPENAAPPDRSESAPETAKTVPGTPRTAAPDTSGAAAAPDSSTTSAEETAGAAPTELSQPPGPAEPWYQVRAVAELGFLAVLSHKVQFGRNSTYFDYAAEGGQDTLFPVTRFSIEAELFRRHQIIFLYQPLEISTRVNLERDLVVDNLTFPAGTPMELRYGFPFYRLTYAYDAIKSPRHELSFGLALQIRNATIEFASSDGTLLRSNRGVGPVPLLRSRGRYSFTNGAFLGYEVDGIYAPISVLNGSDNEVTGALVDASLRAGLRLPLNAEGFVNIRYLAGGAVGQSDPEPPGDGYTRNWLHFLTVSLGASIGTR